MIKPIARTTGAAMSVLAGVWLMGLIGLWVGIWWIVFLLGDDWKFTFSFNHFGEAWFEGLLFHGVLAFSAHFLIRELRRLPPR